MNTTTDIALRRLETLTIIVKEMKDTLDIWTEIGGERNGYSRERSSRRYLSRYNPVKGLFDSWLTPDPC